MYKIYCGLILFRSNTKFFQHHADKLAFWVSEISAPYGVALQKTKDESTLFLCQIF